MSTGLFSQMNISSSATRVALIYYNRFAVTIATYTTLGTTQEVVKMIQFLRQSNYSEANLGR